MVEIFCGERADCWMFISQSGFAPQAGGIVFLCMEVEIWLVIFQGHCMLIFPRWSSMRWALIGTIFDLNCIQV